MTQAQVAEAAGLDRSYISAIESGRRGVERRDTVACLAAALGVTVTDLTGQPQTPTGPQDTAVHVAAAKVRDALMACSLEDGADVGPRERSLLEADAELAAEARQDCDYIRSGTVLATLVPELHAAVHHGDRAVLPVLGDVLHTTSCLLRHVGYPAEAWMAAERESDDGRRADQRRQRDQHR
jgi:transcriptional regulator with XRE-family HTH domain